MHSKIRGDSIPELLLFAELRFLVLFYTFYIDNISFIPTSLMQITIMVSIATQL